MPPLGLGYSRTHNAQIKPICEKTHNFVFLFVFFTELEKQFQDWTLLLNK